MGCKCYVFIWFYFALQHKHFKPLEWHVQVTKWQWPINFRGIHYCFTNSIREHWILKSLNPFPNDKFQTLPNWKSLQTAILRLWKSPQKDRRQCGKRRNYSLHAIFPFPTVFSKDLHCRQVNPGLVWERVKRDGVLYIDGWMQHYPKCLYFV